MSFDFTSSANHADSTGTPVIAVPTALSIWVKFATLAQARKILSIVKSGDNTEMMALVLDQQTNSGKPAVYIIAGAATTQTLANAAVNTGVWVQLIAGFPSTGTRNITVNGTPTVVGPVGVVVPAGLSIITLSGRQGDHLQNLGGLAAHAGILAGRDFTATERQYIGAGGNLRAISALAAYYKLNHTTGGGLIIPDEVGTHPLNVTGVMAAGADDPPVATWMTAGPVANLLLAQGAAVNVNLSSPFDNVSSAFTCSLQQLGAPTQVTTTIGAAAVPSMEAALSSSAAFSVGDYIQLGLGGSPQPVLFVNGGAATVLFDSPQTWAAGAPVYRFPVLARPIPGCAVAGNLLTGNATTAANYASCFTRATCNANGALFADSNFYSITVANALAASLIFRKPRRRIFVKTYTRR